jgi:hypothetical protein
MSWVGRSWRAVSAAWTGSTRQQKIAIAFGAMLFLVAVAALAWTLVTGTPPEKKLPGYALHSTFIFQVERAVALAVGFALVGVFCARLIAGDLPSGISTKGIEWKAESEIAAGLKKAQESVENVTSAAETNAQAIEKLRNELDSLGTTLRGDVVTTLSKTQQSLHDVSLATEAQAEGIRIVGEELQPLISLPEQLGRLQAMAEGLPEKVDDLGQRLARLEDETVGQLVQRLDKLEQDEDYDSK